ncbi:MAG TPA: hypothetical protein VLJ39_17805, partial [Tepidisphaeraceae bacterium]|nr:hypothetical protein [Tepidisphaeraceae bacterium]
SCECERSLNVGQAANSNRKSNLDEKKERAAGRQQRKPEREAIKDFQSPLPAKGKTGGARGRDDRANPEGTGGYTRGAGGGGGAPAPAKSTLDVGTKRK